MNVVTQGLMDAVYFSGRSRIPAFAGVELQFPDVAVNIQLTPQLVQAVRDAVSIVAIASEHTRLARPGRRYQRALPAPQGEDALVQRRSGAGPLLLLRLRPGRRRDQAPHAALRRRLPGGDRVAGAPLRHPAAEPQRPARAAPDGRSAISRRCSRPRRVLRATSSQSRSLRQRLSRAAQDPGRADRALRPRLRARRLAQPGRGAPPADPARPTSRPPAWSARPESGGEPYDRFRNRLMFPIRNASGRLVGFGGRTLGDDKAKYVNTAETERFHKGTCSTASTRPSARSARPAGLLLVEGYFDVLGAVALRARGRGRRAWARRSPPSRRSLLARYAEEVVVGYDGDDAGENASRRALAAPARPRVWRCAGRASPRREHDPDSLRVEAGRGGSRQAVETAPGLRRARDRPLDPAARRTAIRGCSAKAAPGGGGAAARRSATRILRYGYGRVAAERLGVPVGCCSGGAWGSTRQALQGSGRPQGGTEAAARRSRALEESVLAASARRDRDAVPTCRRVCRPPDAFLDPGCRNIYATFLRSIMRAERRAPRAAGCRARSSELGATGGAIDRVAQTSVRRPASPTTRASSGSPCDKLDAPLASASAAKELTREIAEAERGGRPGAPTPALWTRRPFEPAPAPAARQAARRRYLSHGI